MPNATTDPIAVARSGEPSGMRWPIRLQLLIPMVSVVLLASFVGHGNHRLMDCPAGPQRAGGDLRRVTRTLGEAAFPLTGPVLLQMKGLSGAEFVLIGPQGRLEESTLPVEKSWLEDLARIARTAPERRPAPARRRSPWASGIIWWIWSASPAASPAAEPATLLILYPEDQLASRVRQAVYPALIAGLVAAAIAVAIATWLARRLARPIGRLVARTAAIAQGDFTPMPVARRNDELRDLAESINRMTAQLAGYEAAGPPQRAAEDLGPVGGVDGPSTPQRGHRRPDGHRAAPPRLSPGRGRRIAGRGPAATAADGVVLASIPLDRASRRPPSASASTPRCWWRRC